MAARAQSALEYLITYGWAILIITVVLVAVAALGLFSPNTLVTQQCVLNGGLSCQSYQLVSDGQLSMDVQQVTQGPITITAIGCNTQPSTVMFNQVGPTTLQVGGSNTFAVECMSGTTPFTGTVGTVYNGYVGINYTEAATGIKHTIYGPVTVKIAATATSTSTSTTSSSTSSTSTSSTSSTSTSTTSTSSTTSTTTSTTTTAPPPPSAIATGQNYPFAIAVGGGDVYWTNGGGVSSVPIGGGTVTTLSTEGEYSQGMMYYSGNVYWSDTNGGNIFEVPATGGTTTTLVTGIHVPVGITTDGTNLYWADADSADPTINMAPLTGGTPTVIATDPIGGTPTELAVYNGNVFWTDDSLGTVYQAPIAGGSVITLATGQAEPDGIVVTGGNVYWTTAGGGTVEETPIGGGTVTTIASGLTEALLLTTDGTNLYWTTGFSGNVDEESVGGGPVTVLATGQSDAVGIAVDSANVYWTDYYPPGDGSVEQTPK